MTTRSDRVSATLLGIPLAEYLAHVEACEAWCPRCRRWLDERVAFASDMSRPTGRQWACRECRAAMLRERRRRVRDAA